MGASSISLRLAVAPDNASWREEGRCGCAALPAARQGGARAAGCSQHSAAEETSLEVARRMLDLNTLAPIALTPRGALPAMLQVQTPCCPMLPVDCARVHCRISL